MYQGKFQRQPPPVPRNTVREPRLGSLIFYSLLCSFLLLFWLGVHQGMQLLNAWLCNYEAAQPDRVCQAVFDSLFSHPDWGALYDRSGQQTGAYENRDTFVSWMEEKTAGRELTYLETSAGLSGDRKYMVRLEGESIGSFTLTNRKESDTSGLPDWQLGSLELWAEGSQSYTIQAPEGSLVLVNGQSLDDSHIIARRVSLAEDYLPAGTAAPVICTWQVTKLLTVPEVTVSDASDASLDTSFESSTGCFSAHPAQPRISPEEQETALKAARTYALYMIRKAGAGELAKYFNRNSDTYRAITSVELSFVQSAAKQEFADEEVTDYVRYSENLFSVRVSLNLKQTRRDGTVKDNPIDQSLFFSRETGGKWLCYAMTAVDTTQTREQVRLTFRTEETVLQDGFVDADSPSIQCPVPDIPAGKTFGGWMTEETGSDGEPVLRLVFVPDGSGLVELPEGTLLTPMTLYPLFE